MELNNEDRKAIQETHDAVVELRTVVLGSNGRGGLLNDIKEFQTTFASLHNDINKSCIRLTEITGEVSVMSKKVNLMDKELHDEEEGLSDRVLTLEHSAKTTNKWVGAVWGVLVAALSALFSLFFTHLNVK